MKNIMYVGAILVILGILGFAVPYFTTSDTKDVAKVGDLKIQTTESTAHTIPPMAAGAAMILGALMIGASFYKKA